jgi:hypothetical protein
MMHELAAELPVERMGFVRVPVGDESRDAVDEGRAARETRLGGAPPA